MLKRGSTIGILGGGQLGRMMAMSAATRNHEVLTSTSLPATVPTLKVPGGRWSLTRGGYPTGGHPGGRTGGPGRGCRRDRLAWTS